MLVLICAAGSFLLFLAVLACLFVAQTLEAREITRKRNVWSRGTTALLCLPQAFEPMYAALWEEPTAALRMVAAKRGGVSAASLYPVFRRATLRFPEIYDGCGFLQWLEFLEAEELIRCEINCTKVTITAKGTEFLANRFVSDALLHPSSKVTTMV
jgi:hypothetical protein